MKEKYNKRKPQNLGSKSKIKKAITVECLRSWLASLTKEKQKVNDFAKQWIADNVTCEPKHVLIQAYNDIIKKKTKIKKRAKKELEKIEKEEKSSESMIDDDDDDIDDDTRDAIKKLRMLHKLQRKEAVKYEESKEYELSPITIKHWIQKYKKTINLKKK